MEEFHKDLYYTLFESHLSYCISAWGGVHQSKLDPIHKIQKKVVRILFGDNEAFAEKFRTCARTRILDKQILDGSFYVKEHTKPLFRENKILVVYNLYYYHSFMEAFRILKLRSPMCIYSQYQLSARTYLTFFKLIPPKPSNHFIYRTSVIWNTLRQKLDINDISISTSSVKKQLRNILHTNQHNHHNIDWLPSHDFSLDTI